MKKILLLQLLFPFVLSTMEKATAQSFEVIDYSKLNCYYTYEFNPDSTNFGKKIMANMVLQVGQSCSRFLEFDEYFGDSLSYFTELTGDFANFASQLVDQLQSGKSHVLSDFDIYKNYPQKGKVLSRFTSTDHSYIEAYDSLGMNWKLHNERDTVIAGYKCYLATTHFSGRDYEAWFTPEVPINEGPFKFCGLPGLIVLVYDSKGFHKFQLTSITKHSGSIPILYYTKKHKQLTHQEFIKAFNASIMYMYNKVQRNEAGITMSKQDMADMLRWLKTLNNYIEKQ